ncbi:hypothetical protein J1614_011242 [Plenodomus biglobosus]|nr:hypothetical protein J1614_011242 [Plenodomus biglobosus]
MKYEILLIALIGAVAAHPAPRATKREVPQEHAHENILRAVNNILMQDNPDEIADAVFGLLGAEAAANGAGDIADADCLQQATADQAFTNAKAIGDVDAMTNALIYRALERNTGSVGQVSVPCTSIQAVNPEIAALQQHQDPASDGAEALNKEIASELARQIAAIGGDPTLANEASTFAPGEIGDPTGAGNTCDDADDEAGCINTLNLRVDDLTEEEIAAAVAGAGAEAEAGQAGADNANAGADADANAGNNTANACNIVDDSKADDVSADAGDAQAEVGISEGNAGNNH